MTMYGIIFTANDTAMTVSARNYSAGITKFGASIYSGSCGGTEDVADCNAGAADSLVFHNLTVGTQYYLEVFTNGTAVTGTFDICVYGHGYTTGVVETAALSKSLNVYPNPAPQVSCM